MKKFRISLQFVGLVILFYFLNKIYFSACNTFSDREFETFNLFCINFIINIFVGFFMRYLITAIVAYIFIKYLNKFLILNKSIMDKYLCSFVLLDFVMFLGNCIYTSITTSSFEVGYLFANMLAFIITSFTLLYLPMFAVYLKLNKPE